MLLSTSTLQLVDCFKQNHHARRQEAHNSEHGANPENGGRKLLATLFTIADDVSFFH
jgi:hypothetical protein